MNVRPVTATIGAEILDVDLQQELSQETVDLIRAALLQWGVIFFLDQDITLDQHLAFVRHFGELDVHPAAPGPPGYPEVLVVHADENSKWVPGELWHSDVSANDEPSLGSILRLTTVPLGGDTLFANMYAAFEGLSPAMRQALSGMTARHSAEHVYRPLLGRSVDEAHPYPETSHPVVRTHPETGRQALYVNSQYTTVINELTRTESDAILRMLYAHINDANYQCRFRWAPNSIAFWDNRAVQHFAVWDYFPAVRHGFRVTIKGDRPYYDPGGALRSPQAQHL